MLSATTERALELQRLYNQCLSAQAEAIKSRPYKAWLYADLVANPLSAFWYVRAAVQDSWTMTWVALRNVWRAYSTFN